MYTNSKLFFAFALLVPVASSGKALHLEKLLSVPVNAKEVKRYSDKSREQVSYKIGITFPREALSDAAKKRLTSDGWAQCVSRPESTWATFGDATSSTSTWVFQRLYFYKKNDELLTISMQYVEKKLSNNQPAQPNNNTQIVRAVKMVTAKEVVQSILESNNVTCS
jgi:hypothetical protein